MIGDRLTSYITANDRRMRLQFFEGILVDDLFRAQVDAVAYEFITSRPKAFMRLIPKIERERLLKQGVESR